jgi:cytidine deaminase
MLSKEIRVTYEEYSSRETLDPVVAGMIERAYKAADKAYAPYSGFHVGVALELANGEVFTAGNQENKAYPSGLCAERVALFYVQANYPDVAIQRMVLVSKTDQGPSEEPAFPCGACRQVMVESAERQGVPYEIWMAGRNRIIRVDSPEALLPLKFLL